MDTIHFNISVFLVQCIVEEELDHIYLIIKNISIFRKYISSIIDVIDFFLYIYTTPLC